MERLGSRAGLVCLLLGLLDDTSTRWLLFHEVSSLVLSKALVICELLSRQNFASLLLTPSGLEEQLCLWSASRFGPWGRWWLHL